MTPTVARAIAEGIFPAAQDDPAPVELVWHGGEPLTMQPAKFEELVKPFVALQKNGLVQHVLQTNGTLITDAWCDLLSKYEFGIGVSIDGPASHNRIDWQGRPVLARIVNGLEKLEGRGIKYGVMAVIDRTAVGDIDKVLNFLSSLKAKSIAINLEEREGINRHNGSPSADEARLIWRDIFTWAAQNRSIRIREVEHLLSYLAHPPAEKMPHVLHDPLPTIGWNGDVVALSPELLGIKSDRYSNFIAGNILTKPLYQILEKVPTLLYAQEFQSGIQKCAQSCDYFAFCKGAEAGNRFFEHGRFSTTETRHCQNSVQALVAGFSDLAKREGKIQDD